MQFIEAPSFARKRLLLLKPEAFRALQADPKKGAFVRGTSDCRKIRVPAPGRSKRGGARAICYLHEAPGRVHLLMLFAKNDQADLTPQQARGLAAVLRRLKN